MFKTDFCKQLWKNICSSYYFPIKRSFGQTLQNCQMNALIAYSKIATTQNETDQNIEFLIAGLCYNTVKPQTAYENKTIVRFENVLKRLNREKEIENFLMLRYDNTGYFAKRFMSLAKKTIPFLKSDEQFDYDQLIYDFKNWNKNTNVKMRWAMSIVNNEKEGN